MIEAKRTMVAVGIALLAAMGILAFGTPGLGQERLPRVQERHHWVVLLDVSLTFEGLQADVSRPMAIPGYQVRNELLALTETLLAGMRLKEREQRADYLDVFVFGRGVQRIETGKEPVRWESVEREQWWQRQIPTGMGRRTQIFEALRAAKDTFEVDPDSDLMVKHLVVISDGELDVGDHSRAAGGRLQQEELKRYRNALDPNTEVMRWLRNKGVITHTLTVDPELGAMDDDRQRQQQIQAKLFEFESAGYSPLTRALALIESLVEDTGDGVLPYSEGPYVMRALADEFGGQARSVNPANVLEILWQIIFPDARRRGFFLAGDRQVLLFPRRDDDVRLFLKDECGNGVVKLLYDPVAKRAVLEPNSKDVRARVRMTSQYAAWWIDSPCIDRIEPDVLRTASRNVKPVWRKEAPPGKALRGAQVALTLDFLWTGLPAEPDKDWWRRYLGAVDHEAVASIERPDGTVVSRELTAEIATGDDNRVASFSGVIFDTERAGAYNVKAALVLREGDDEEPWYSDPVKLTVFADSPLRDFKLAVRPWPEDRDRPGPPITIPEPARSDSEPVELKHDGRPRVVFEWRSGLQRECEGLDQLELELSSPERVFLDADNVFRSPSERLDEGDEFVCYQTEPLRLGTQPGRFPATVTASDKLTRWTRKVRVTAPPSPLRRLLLGTGSLLGLLLIAASVALAASPHLRRRSKSWVAATRAPMPFGVTLEREGRQEALTWSEGDARRLVVGATESGELIASFQRRVPPGVASVAELVPISKSRYRVRLVRGSGWTVRKISGDGRQGASFPLSRRGEEIPLYEFHDDLKLELIHDTGRVVIQHRSTAA